MRSWLVRATATAFFSCAFDRVAAREQLGDVLAGDLVLNSVYRDRLRAREPILYRQHAEQHQVADQPYGDAGPTRSRRRWRRSGGRPSVRQGRAGRCAGASEGELSRAGLGCGGGPDAAITPVPDPNSP